MACSTCGSSLSTCTCASTCCNNTIQPAPQPCCEASETVCKTGVCFRPTCDVTAVANSTFFLTFTEGDCSKLSPLNFSELYFWHAATSLLQIVGFNGTSYEVQLVDETKAGAVIEKDDCVLTAVVPQSTLTAGISTRCLSGQFVAPAVNATTTIVILNGSGIPIGSTLTFTANGETGSYVVTAYISASGNEYAYTVQNTGSGHTPGTIISGGDVGACLVPIEIITDVDICNLSEANSADSITVCLNGSPRALVPTGEGDVPVGTSDGDWELRRLADFDCCVVLAGCLKFTEDNCVDACDSVELEDTGLDCFEAAWNAADAIGNNLHMNIDGVEVVVTAYDSGTRIATFCLSEAPYAEIIQYDAGTQVCIGECCESCNLGPQVTNHNNLTNPDGELHSVFAFTGATLPYDSAAVTQYLIGQNNTTGALTVLTIDATFNDGGPAVIIPRHSNPLLIREKICNTDLNGCHQSADLDFNVEISYDGLPANFRVFTEVGHYAGNSATLADGVTANPGFPINVSTQAAWAVCCDGPSSEDTTALPDTLVGFGGQTQAKVFPYLAGHFRDYLNLDRCNCANSIVWWYVRIVPLAGAAGTGNVSASLNIRRRIRKFSRNFIEYPANDPDLEGFA